MEESPKQKTGFSQKLFPTVAAFFSGVTREINMLTTDAIPDKSYTEKTPGSSQGKKSNVKSNNLEDNSVSLSDSSDNEEEIENNWESKKKKNFSFSKMSFAKSKKKSEKSNHANSKGQKNVYYFNNINGLHVGNNYNVMHGVRVTTTQNTSKETEKVKVEITQDIRDALSSNATVNSDHIMEVQSHIGNNWMNLGRRLGFSDGEIEQFQSDFSPQRERIYQMLLSWTRSEPDKCTVGFLCHCLWEVNERQAVKKLAEYINNKSKLNID